MASILTTLSNDILLEILSSLSQTDLYTVALVSRRLRGPAQRILYRSVYLRLQVPNLTKYCPITGNLDLFTRFVKTISDSPHLGSSVSKLSISVWLFTGGPRFRDHSDLLGLLPSLRSLSLRPPPFNFQLSMLPSSALETLHLGFASGRDRNGNGEPHDPLEIIEQVFWATHLRRLLIDGISFTPELSTLFPPSRHRTSPITDLEFRSDNQEKFGCLPNILACIKELKRFTFEMHTPWEASHCYARGMEPAALGQMIGIHASTLETLEIAASDAAEFPDTSLFGSLAWHPNLKRLAIPDELLVVVENETSTLIDVLPPKLEELQLQFAMLRMHGNDRNRSLRVNRLLQLATAKEARFPALRRVIWWCQPCECWDNDGSRYGPISDMEDLKAAFQEVDVDFEFTSDPYFEGSPFGGKESGHPWGSYVDDE